MDAPHPGLAANARNTAGDTAAAGNGAGNTAEAAPSVRNCVGVVIRLPEPLAAELEDWRASFGDPMAALIPAHITLVTTTPVTDWDAVLEHVRRVARRQEPFEVRLRGTATFRPVSPVVFLQVAEGFEQCAGLHAELQSGPLQRDPDFPYHPHVTVAHDVSEAGMESALTRLRGYDAAFTVRTMGLYEHERNGVWRLREELRLGEQRPGGDARRRRATESTGARQAQSQGD